MKRCLYHRIACLLLFQFVKTLRALERYFGIKLFIQNLLKLSHFHKISILVWLSFALMLTSENSHGLEVNQRRGQPRSRKNAEPLFSLSSRGLLQLVTPAQSVHGECRYKYKTTYYGQILHGFHAIVFHFRRKFPRVFVSITTESSL